jgi:hypothetical protein
VADVFLLVCHSGDIVDGSGAGFVLVRHLMYICVSGGIPFLSDLVREHAAVLVKFINNFIKPGFAILMYGRCGWGVDSLIMRGGL